jgi:hypothetical protein
LRAVRSCLAFCKVLLRYNYYCRLQGTAPVKMRRKRSGAQRKRVSRFRRVLKIIARRRAPKTLIRHAKLLLLLWNTILAVGILSVLLRYKLEVGWYFVDLVDIFDRDTLKRFFSEKWEALLLSAVLLLTYWLLTKDSSKWTDQAEKCFSPTNVPSRLKIVRNRWIINWVVLSNIVIFLAAIYFVDSVKVFAGLFLVHHANAVAWLIAFRKNVAYYFYSPRYMPKDSDPFKKFRFERRRVMERYLSKTPNIERESLTAAGYGAALVLALANQLWDVTFYAAPHLIVVITEATNQYYSYRERRERDQGLRKIEVQEERLSSADLKRRG